MGYDLMGHGGASFNITAWPKLLDLAVCFGWKPEGTKAPDEVFLAEFHGVEPSKDPPERNSK